MTECTREFADAAFLLGKALSKIGHVSILHIRAMGDEFFAGLSRHNLIIMPGFEPIGDTHKDGENWLIANQKHPTGLRAWWGHHNNYGGEEKDTMQDRWHAWSTSVYGEPTHAMAIPKLIEKEAAEQD